MLRVIIALSVVLLISLTGNYALYQKVKTKDILLVQQTASLKELNSKVELNNTIRAIGDSVFKEVVHSVEASDKSFDMLLSNLPIVGICEQTNEITNTPKVSNSDAALISAYYDKLHSAYNLQNKH